MDQSQISAASSPDNSQQRNFDSMEQSPIYQAYPQGSLAAAPWGNQQNQTNQEAFSGFFDNMPWLENDHMAIYDSALYVSSNDASHDVDWSAMQGQQVPMNDYSNPSSIMDSPSSMAEYQGQWAPSPSGYAPTVSTAWMPNSEPFASPLSEAPSYGSETPPYGAEVPGYESYSFAHNQAADNAPAVPTTSFFSDALRVHAAAASPATSPTATSASHRQNIAPTPIKPAKRGPGRPKGSGNKPKLPNGEKAAKGTKRKSPAASPDSSTSDTSMNIGIFPPNVDVKKASQKLQREAWEKCRTEAASLAQRRELLLAARTETQKETEKLQASMGQLREAVARETGQLYEAVRIAARLNTSDYY